mmetsp:Transcript_20720/g.49116  ORF Transcript_20720/g.49116 Transcript_20720/m.49116 type:complete len:227 (+) Transcript_20720:192-872(+)
MPLRPHPAHHHRSLHSFRYLQQVAAETPDPGERSRGWLLQHLRLCDGLRGYEHGRAKPQRAEAEEARAFLLAEGDELLSAALCGLYRGCAIVHRHGSAHEQLLAHHRHACVPELLPAAGLVPLGGGDLESTHLVLVGPDLRQRHHAYGAAGSGEVVQGRAGKADGGALLSVAAAEAVVLSGLEVPLPRGVRGAHRAPLPLERDAVPPLWCLGGNHHGRGGCAMGDA